MSSAPLPLEAPSPVLPQHHQHFQHPHQHHHHHHQLLQPHQQLVQQQQQQQQQQQPNVPTPPLSASSANASSSASSSSAPPTPDVVKVPRKRRRWTEEEERALLDGVRKHGIGAWAVILADADLWFDNRTSVDLKDKWRVMTVRKPKNAPPLPLDLSSLSRVSKPKRTKDDQLRLAATKAERAKQQQQQQQQFTGMDSPTTPGGMRPSMMNNGQFLSATAQGRGSLAATSAAYMSNSLPLPSASVASYPEHAVGQQQQQQPYDPSAMGMHMSSPLLQQQHHHQQQQQYQQQSQLSPQHPQQQQYAAYHNSPHHHPHHYPHHHAVAAAAQDSLWASSVPSPLLGSHGTAAPFSPSTPGTATSFTMSTGMTTPVSNGPLSPVLTILQHRVSHGQLYYLVRYNGPGQYAEPVWRSADTMGGHEQIVQQYHNHQQQLITPPTTVTSLNYSNNSDYQADFNTSATSIQSANSSHMSALSLPLTTTAPLGSVGYSTHHYRLQGQQQQPRYDDPQQQQQQQQSRFLQQNDLVPMMGFPSSVATTAQAVAVSSPAVGTAAASPSMHHYQQQQQSHTNNGFTAHQYNGHGMAVSELLTSPHAMHHQQQSLGNGVTYNGSSYIVSSMPDEAGAAAAVSDYPTSAPAATQYFSVADGMRSPTFHRAVPASATTPTTTTFTLPSQQQHLDGAAVTLAGPAGGSHYTDPAATASYQAMDAAAVHVKQEEYTYASPRLPAYSKPSPQRNHSQQQQQQQYVDQLQQQQQQQQYASVVHHPTPAHDMSNDSFAQSLSAAAAAQEAATAPVDSSASATAAAPQQQHYF
ncbi:hypothetical protein RI367_002370 [Sorochytrium milnesiophthora]